jgi:hypothetical protein
LTLTRSAHNIRIVTLSRSRGASMSAEVLSVPAPRLGVFGHAYRGQPVLAVTGVLLLAVMAPTLVALGLDTRLLNGISVWIKPLKFEAALAVHLLTVAWVMLCLPQEIRDSRLARGLAMALAAAALFEIAYIALQAARGEASHFNRETLFAGVMYSLMGVGAVILVGTSTVIGGLILRHGQRHRPIVFAAGFGLILGGVLGGITGAYMSAQAGHWVGGVPSDAGGLAIFGWSRLGGDLRVAHFFGLHLMQALPLTAWLGAQFAPGRLQFPLIGTVAAAGALVTLATLVQAMLGRPFLG